MNSYFRLSTHFTKDSCHITMIVDPAYIHTRQLPATFPILEEKLPAIFQTKCFNPDNFPFEKEVQATPTGHLFEHILLTYLGIQKTQEGFSPGVHNGQTSWNWIMEPRGTYHITISIGDTRRQLIGEALEKTELLTRYIFARSFQYKHNLPS